MKDGPINRSKIYSPGHAPTPSPIRYRPFISEDRSKKVESNTMAPCIGFNVTSSACLDWSHFPKAFAFRVIQAYHAAVVSDDYTNFLAGHGFES